MSLVDIDAEVFFTDHNSQPLKEHGFQLPRPSSPLNVRDYSRRPSPTQRRFEQEAKINESTEEENDDLFPVSPSVCRRDPPNPNFSSGVFSSSVVRHQHLRYIRRTGDIPAAMPECGELAAKRQCDFVSIPASSYAYANRLPSATLG